MWHHCFFIDGWSQKILIFFAFKSIYVDSIINLLSLSACFQWHRRSGHMISVNKALWSRTDDRYFNKSRFWGLHLNILLLS